MYEPGVAGRDGPGFRGSIMRVYRWILASLLVAPAALADGPKPPNVVLIYADDLGYGDVGFNGRTSWRTPNLDKLAGQGVTLRRFYTAAVVCAPSRAAMLTGKQTIHCGVSRNNADLPSGETTLAEALKERGYSTALFGKWHHGVPARKGDSYIHPMDQGFDEFFGYTDATDAWEKFPEKLWDGRAQKPSKGYADDRFTDRAVEFLGRRKSSPFFLYLPLISAHFNIDAPADEVALHAGRFKEADPSKPINATYAAMVTRFDKNVGAILRALDDLGLSENTVVVFTSDHGATFESGNLGTSAFHDSNAPFRGQKRTLWEGGIRVPACVRWPSRIAPNTYSDVNMQAIDLFPTLLAAAGGRAEGVDGVDLRGIWEGREAAIDRTLFWEWRSEGYDQVAALRGDLKLVVTRRGKPELFDVAADPAERRDVAAAHADEVDEIQASLAAWLATESKR